MAWIAYNEARLTEAASLLVMARRMIFGTKTKLIGSYLDTLQATIIMSESVKPDRINEALCLLKNAYSTLPPPNSLQHEHYALRCQNEIARAFLRLAGASRDDPAQKEEHLKDAETHIAKVKAAAKRSLKTAMKTELKTYCSALIIESRVKRERGRPDDALALAKEAKRDGVDIDPIQVDACIAAGEAEQARGAYGKAISAFREALEKGRDNRKDAAACHLHLCCTYLLDNQPAKARDHFNIWEFEQAGVENAFIADLAVRARKMLFTKFQEFQRTRDDVERHGKHKFHLDSLRRWLAETALALDHDDYAKAAQRLEVNIVTLKEWLKL
jgi:tetratricopeptide (TPR) repeat protein